MSVAQFNPCSPCCNNSCARECDIPKELRLRLYDGRTYRFDLNYFISGQSELYENWHEEVCLFYDKEEKAWFGEKEIFYGLNEGCDLHPTSGGCCYPGLFSYNKRLCKFKFYHKKTFDNQCCYQCDITLENFPSNDCLLYDQPYSAITCLPIYPTYDFSYKVNDLCFEDENGDKQFLFIGRNEAVCFSKMYAMSSRNLVFYDIGYSFYYYFGYYNPVIDGKPCKGRTLPRFDPRIQESCDSETKPFTHYFLYYGDDNGCFYRIEHWNYGDIYYQYKYFPLIFICTKPMPRLVKQYIYSLAPGGEGNYSRTFFDPDFYPHDLEKKYPTDKLLSEYLSTVAYYGGNIRQPTLFSNTTGCRWISRYTAHDSQSDDRGYKYVDSTYQINNELNNGKITIDVKGCTYGTFGYYYYFFHGYSQRWYTKTVSGSEFKTIDGVLTFNKDGEYSFEKTSRVKLTESTLNAYILRPVGGIEVEYYPPEEFPPEGIWKPSRGFNWYRLYEAVPVTETNYKAWIAPIATTVWRSYYEYNPDYTLTSESSFCERPHPEFLYVTIKSQCAALDGVTIKVTMMGWPDIDFSDPFNNQYGGFFGYNSYYGQTVLYGVLEEGYFLWGEPTSVDVAISVSLGFIDSNQAGLTITVYKFYGNTPNMVYNQRNFICKTQDWGENNQWLLPEFLLIYELNRPPVINEYGPLGYNFYVPEINYTFKNPWTLGVNPDSNAPLNACWNSLPPNPYSNTERTIKLSFLVSQ